MTAEIVLPEIHSGHGADILL